MTQALSLPKYRVFFFSVKKFIFKPLPSVAYFIDLYKYSKVEFGISNFRATKFREKRCLVLMQV